MIGAKIQFSEGEIELMNNRDIILTKNRILSKIKGVLDELQTDMVAYKETSFSLYEREYFVIPPKISKGENYLGLPYLILDYPRNFKQESIFAIRTMFWWGNFFSITLHLSGVAKDYFLPSVQNSFRILLQHQFSIGVNPDPWQHHFEKTNYRSLADMDKNDFIAHLQTTPHIKIAAQWPLLGGTSAANNILAKWMLLLQICFN